MEHSAKQEPALLERVARRARADGFRPPRWAAPLGAALVFAVLAALVVTAVLLLRPKEEPVTDPAALARYTGLMEAPAIVDMAPFADGKPSPEQMVPTAVTRALLAGSGEFSERPGFVRVPAEKVKTSAAALFGDAAFSHCTVKADGLSYEYDKAEGCYYVSATALDGGYQAKILRAVKKGKTVIVTAGYASAYAQPDEAGDVPVEKQMKFVFREEDEAPYLYALEQG